MGHDDHLAAGPFAVFGAVGVAQDVEFTHGIHAQQLLAGASRLHVVLGSARVLDAIEQEEILLRPIARDGEVVSGRGVGYPDSAGLLRGEIDDAGIQRQQQIVASPVQGKILHLLFPHQAGDVRRGHTHQRRVRVHLNLLAYGSHVQSDIHAGVLPDDQTDAGPDLFRKPLLRHSNLIRPDRKREHLVLAGLARRCGADRAGFQVLHRNRSAGNGGAGLMSASPT